jgi:hypothetical protein
MNDNHVALAETAPWYFGHMSVYYYLKSNYVYFE